MKYRILTIVLFACLATCVASPATEKPDIMPVEEGWVNAASNGKWSDKEPMVLNVRAQGTEKAWATYLMFELPKDADSLAGRKLILQFTKNEKGELQNTNGVFSLFGIAVAQWTAKSLNAQNAPAWDAVAFNVKDEATKIASNNVDSPSIEQIAFPIEGAFLEFCRKNAEKKVTLIITKVGRSSACHSNRGSPEGGPRIR